MTTRAARTRRDAAPVALSSSAVGLPPWLRHALRTVVHLILDAAAVYAAYRLAFWIRFEWSWFVAQIPPTGDPANWEKYGSLLTGAVPLWLFCLYSSRLYTASWMTGADRFLQIVRACALGAGTTLVAAFLYERLAFSRVMLASVFPVALMLVSLTQWLALRLDDFLASMEAAKPVLLVGGGSVAPVLRERILARHPGAAVEELDALPARGGEGR